MNQTTLPNAENSLDKKFLRKLTWLNGLGMLIIVASPLIIDPRLKSHVQFPNRTYSIYRWLWVLMCIPVVFGTYYLGYGRKMRGWTRRTFNILNPTLILTVPALVIAFLFPPEYPHMGIFVWTFAYGLVTLFTKKVLNAPPLAVGMDEPSCGR